MRAQIQIDAEDTLRCLQTFLALYATVLNPQQCKALAEAIHVLIYKTK